MTREKKTVKTIEMIESLLKEDALGVLAFPGEDSNVEQLVVPFIYFEKNVYLLIKKNDEKLNFESEDKKISFTIFNDLNSKFENQVHKMAFKYVEIYLKGFLKKVNNENKLSEFCNEFKKKYYSYKKNSNTEICNFKEVSICMIDTEEIHAAEITGGLN